MPFTAYRKKTTKKQNYNLWNKMLTIAKFMFCNIHFRKTVRICSKKSFSLIMVKLSIYCQAVGRSIVF